MFGDLFKAFMIDYSKMFMEEMLKCYQGFDGLNLLVDIIENSPSYSGIEHVAGNMFKRVPKGDATFMKGKTLLNDTTVSTIHDYAHELYLAGQTGVEARRET
ncbi:hypothetical protein V6N13_130512 [Hibiscus sabdariffa]